jgi:Zn-dependent peptidase ImmA (M78 family)
MTVRQDADRAAQAILADTWNDSLPVDPVRIARLLGMDVITASLAPDVAGALVKERGQDPSIVLNAKDSSNRQRFTCAHEVGHFVRRKESGDDYEYIDYRDIFSSTGEREEERFANSFAACLLMPEEHVRRFHRKGLSDIQMALRFDVSRDAMSFRIANLNLNGRG